MISSIVKAIQSVCPESSTDLPIPLHEPSFKGTNAWTYTKECLDSGWVSTAGIWVNRFEQELANYTSAKHVIAVTNGTVALRLALHLVGVRHHDEVIMPPLSFVATANAASHLGAIPHFVDIDPSNLGLCPTALREHLSHIAERRGFDTYNCLTGKRIAAVLPVHVFGHPANISAIKSVADEWGLPVVEDAAESLGSFCNSIHTGLLGEVGCISFNGNKIITTGGGGALLTNNPKLAAHARYLSTTAKQAHPWEFVHDEVAWNDRMPNLNAALGLSQLEDLTNRLFKKKLLFSKYKAAFADLNNIELLDQPPDSTSNFWLVTARFIDIDRSSAEIQRNKLLQLTHQAGLLLRPIWKPLNQLQMYTNCPSGDLRNSEDQGSRVFNLPSSPQILS